MPTNLPSSFASAAAGQNANRPGGGRGVGDWYVFHLRPRIRLHVVNSTDIIRSRQGRSANGTLTLRRSSTTPLSQASQTPVPSENAVVQPPAPEATAPIPSLAESSPARYSKEHLLDLYRPQRSADDPSRLFMQGWNPGHVNGGGSRAWGKSNDNHIPQEPGACWDQNGESTPMGHSSLTTDEKEVSTFPYFKD